MPFRFIQSLGSLFQKLTGVTLYMDPPQEGVNITAQQSGFQILCQATDTLPAIGLVASWFPYLFSPYQEEAALRIHSLLQRASARDLLQLSNLMRGWGTEFLPYSRSSERITPEHFAALTPSSQTALSVWSVGTLSRNGYIREACVDRLAASESPASLPFLMMRAWDWVEPVRRKAMLAVSQRVTSEYASVFIHQIPLLVRLSETRRDDYTALIQSIRQLLTEQCQAVLMEGCRQSDRESRLYCLRLATGNPQVDLWPIRDELLKHRDPTTRLAAVKKFRVDLSGDDLKTFLDSIRHDSAMGVRREALYGYIANYPDLAVTELNEALMDAHVSIRELARFYLKERGYSGFSDDYRAALEKTEQTRVLMAIALLGLGESGSEADASYVARFAYHASAKVRQAALQSRLRLDASQSIKLALEGVQDASGRVARTGFFLLKEKIRRLEIETLWILFREASQPHTRRFAMALITVHPSMREAYQHFLLTRQPSRQKYVESLALPSLKAPSGITQSLTDYQQWMLSEGIPEEDNRVGFTKFLLRCLSG